MAVLVYITVPEEREALELARGLVEQNLAAGANVAGPVRSFYRWAGRICEAGEWQIFAQARQEDFAALTQFVTQRHSHQVPCIVAIPLGAGYAPFLQWIAGDM